jgi:hypothetical protein
MNEKISWISLTITETIIAWKQPALDEWHNGNPLPNSNFIRKTSLILTLSMKGGLMVG